MDHKSVEDDELLHLKEEINKLCMERRRLITRKYYLECQCYVPRPVNSKQCDLLVAEHSMKTDTAKISKIEMDLKLKLYYMCGMKFTDDENNLRVEMAVSCGPVYMENFFVEIENIEEQFSITSFSVPSAINMPNILKDVSLKTYNDIPIFLRYLHRCLSAFFHRRQQVNDLGEFFETQGYKIDIFSTHHKMYVELQISSSALINSDSDTNIIILLKYKKDSFIPEYVSYVKADLPDSDQLILDSYSKYFLKRHLKEAFIEIMHCKKVKIESVPHTQSSTNVSKQNRSFQQPSSVPSESLNQVLVEKSEISSSSLNISAVTVSEIGASKQMKKGSKDPIASSTPYNLHKKSHSIMQVKAISPKVDQSSHKRNNSYFLRNKKQMK